ncbi:retinol-binding protein 4-B-like [Saccostrea cucullata]|uniref:retinol-binding protein 4-B-like n=1 Tax=Saccostrea cuccullata TaxID=36930 RepID=UPI002ED65C40
MVSWVVVQVFLLAVHLAKFVRSHTHSCPQVSNIPVQSEFDFNRFSGGQKWNLVLYNKIMPIEGLEMPVDKSDIAFLFTRNASDAQVVSIEGRVSLAPSLAFCLDITGSVSNLPGHPAKLRQSYYNPMTKKIFSFNFWVLHTDYKNLAVVYDCEKTMTDGTCSPGNIYLWTLSRGTKHTVVEKAKIKELGDAVCMDVLNLRQVKHNSTCPTV